MSNVVKLGISHALPDDAEIIHSTVLGKSALGRVSDLVSAWCSQKYKMDYPFLGDIRILLQALLEFSCPRGKEGLGLIEVGKDSQNVVIATRFQNILNINVESLEKDLTYFWMNSPEVGVLKRVLSPHDQVEVRLHAKLNLIEWRVYRALNESEEMSIDSPFTVILDDSDKIETESNNYVDLGDLPFEDWMSDVYRNSQDKRKTGEIKIDGNTTQDESEWARITVERETAEIDQVVKREVKHAQEEDKEYVFTTGDDDLSDVETRSGKYSDEKVEELLASQIDLKENLKRLTLDMKRQEIKDSREITGLKEKVRKTEELMRRKELSIQRNTSEIKILQQRLEEEKQKKKDEDKSNHFRDKALEMFEMLKKVKEEKAVLEKTITDMKHKDKAALVAAQVSGGESTGNQKVLDELNKKLERTYRVLEGEKAKVKSLSERVMLAEKEAQGAGPMIKDLENKMEHTLKTVQQHKKETEAVKQKLVQADAEKNKIKNELVKAQAQIQTLMKRQAA